MGTSPMADDRAFHFCRTVDRPPYIFHTIRWVRGHHDTSVPSFRAQGCQRGFHSPSAQAHVFSSPLFPLQLPVSTKGNSSPLENHG